MIGAALVTWITPILPYALAFAAGAMVYVVVDDIVPESQVSQMEYLQKLAAKEVRCNVTCVFPCENLRKLSIFFGFFFILYIVFRFH